jgi:PleD family two-component response regulator
MRGTDAGLNEENGKSGQKCLDFSVARILNQSQAKGGSTMADTDRLAITSVQKVVVVDGNAEVLGMLEAVLDAGRYDMVFVESSDHAYTQIKKVLPNLVIVCARIEQLESFQLLTMLKLDSDTRDIPVLTYTTEYEGQDIDTATSRFAEDDEEFLPSRRPVALRMN